VDKNIYSNIPVFNYSTTEVIIAQPNDTIAYIRKLMQRNRISHCIIVSSENKIEGIISLRDIAKLLTLLGSQYPESLDQIIAKNVMKKEIIKAEKETSVKDACIIMLKNKVGSVVITENEELFGIFTKTDACKVFYDYPLNDVKIEEIMTKKFALINVMASLHKVINKFEEEDIVIVEDNKKPIGVITLSRLAYLDEKDFLKSKVKYVRGKVEEGKIKIGKTAKDIMLEINIGINKNDKVIKAVNYMLSYNIPVIPVIDDYGEIQGVITKSEIVRLIAQS